MEIVTIISLVGGSLGIIFGVASYLKGRDKDSKENTKELVLLRADLDNLDEDLRETRKELIAFKRDTAAQHDKQREELDAKVTAILGKIDGLQQLIIEKLK